MSKGKSKRFTANCPADIAIKDAVAKMWADHRDDLSKWKNYTALFEEQIDLMTPYGDSYQVRKGRHRTKYKKHLDQIFELNGKLFFHFTTCTRSCVSCE